MLVEGVNSPNRKFSLFQNYSRTSIYLRKLKLTLNFACVCTVRPLIRSMVEVLEVSLGLYMHRYLLCLCYLYGVTMGFKDSWQTSLLWFWFLECGIPWKLILIAGWNQWRKWIPWTVKKSRINKDFEAAIGRLFGTGMGAVLL